MVELVAVIVPPLFLMPPPVEPAELKAMVELVTVTVS